MEWYAVQDITRKGADGIAYRTVCLVHFPTGWRAMVETQADGGPARWTVETPDGTEVTPCSIAGWAALGIDPEDDGWAVDPRRPTDGTDGRSAWMESERKRLIADRSEKLESAQIRRYRAFHPWEP